MHEVISNGDENRWLTSNNNIVFRMKKQIWLPDWHLTNSSEIKSNLTFCLAILHGESKNKVYFIIFLFYFILTNNIIAQILLKHEIK